MNRYGYYELRKQNTAEERGRNFEESYFQEYPQEELLSIRNMIEEREYIIEQNLSATGGGWVKGRKVFPAGYRL